MNEYTLLLVHRDHVHTCMSHWSNELPVSYFLGNTNFEKTELDPLHIKFTCLQCGEERTYRRNTEKTLL